jgi:hypothetical protein
MKYEHMALPTVSTNTVDKDSRKTVSTTETQRTSRGSAMNYPKLPNRKYIQGEYAYTSIQMREYAKKCVESALRQHRIVEKKQKQWAGLNWDDIPEIYVGDMTFLHGAKWADAELKKKNAL